VVEVSYATTENTHDEMREKVDTVLNGVR
jgi:hypothetical protein